MNKKTESIKISSTFWKNEGIPGNKNALKKLIDSI